MASDGGFNPEGRPVSPVNAAVNGTNADLIAEVARLYLPEGSVVADITYGKGVFWKKIACSKIKLSGSDLHTIEQHMLFPDRELKQMDFRALEYADESKDIVVFDPPYIHNPGQHITDHRYRNAATTKGLYHSDIIDLYRAGMTEAKRVLKPEGGQLWVKCKNEIESGIQRWSIIEIYNIAIALGMFGRDLFTLVPDARTSSNRWKRQLHARKVHSYMWVFERPKRSDQAGLRRAGVIPPLLGPLPLP